MKTIIMKGIDSCVAVLPVFILISSLMISLSAQADVRPSAQHMAQCVADKLAVALSSRSYRLVAKPISLVTANNQQDPGIQAALDRAVLPQQSETDSSTAEECLIYWDVYQLDSPIVSNCVPLIFRAWLVTLDGRIRGETQVLGSTPNPGTAGSGPWWKSSAVLSNEGATSSAPLHISSLRGAPPMYQVGEFPDLELLADTDCEVRFIYLSSNGHEDIIYPERANSPLLLHPGKLHRLNELMDKADDFVICPPYGLDYLIFEVKPVSESGRAVSRVVYPILVVPSRNQD